MSVLWTASDVAAACGGTLSGPDVDIRGFSTDSRAVKTGDLFVALTDVRDGHDFVAQALDKGAAAALVVGQTVLPGAVGIIFLGDVTRSGWGPAAIVAFVAAVVGGVILASSGAVTAVEKAESVNLPAGYGHRG